MYSIFLVHFLCTLIARNWLTALETMKYSDFFILRDLCHLSSNSPAQIVNVKAFYLQRFVVNRSRPQGPVD